MTSPPLPEQESALFLSQKKNGLGKVKERKNNERRKGDNPSSSSTKSATTSLLPPSTVAINDSPSPEKSSTKSSSATRILHHAVISDHRSSSFTKTTATLSPPSSHHRFRQKNLHRRNLFRNRCDYHRSFTPTLPSKPSTSLSASKHHTTAIITSSVSSDHRESLFANYPDFHSLRL